MQGGGVTTGRICNTKGATSSSLVDPFPNTNIASYLPPGGCSSLCGRPPPRPALQPEHLGQGGPELGGHEAVEEEVGGAVPQGQQVHHLPHRGVARQEEPGPQHGGQQAQDALQNKLILYLYLLKTHINLICDIW